VQTAQRIKAVGDVTLTEASVGLCVAPDAGGTDAHVCAQSEQDLERAGDGIAILEVLDIRVGPGGCRGLPGVRCRRLGRGRRRLLGKCGPDRSRDRCGGQDAVAELEHG